MCQGGNRSWAQKLPSAPPVFLRLGANMFLLLKLETLARKNMKNNLLAELICCVAGLLDSLLK